MLSAPLAHADDEPIDWQDAASCVDQVCSLRGTVAEVKDDGPVIRLYFDPMRLDIYATLVRGWFVTWPDYGGHIIVATGPVDQFRGATEIMLRSPDQIVVLDAALTPLPLTATPPPATETVAPTLTQTIAPTLAPTSVPTAVPTLPAPTAVPPTAVPPPVATQTTEEVDQLRQRVRELEDRVRQLEGAH